MMLTFVLLPSPFGPIYPMISPRLTCRFIWLRTCNEPKLIDKFVNSKIVSSDIQYSSSAHIFSLTYYVNLLSCFWIFYQKTPFIVLTIKGAEMFIVLLNNPNIRAIKEIVCFRSEERRVGK